MMPPIYDSQCVLILLIEQQTFTTRNRHVNELINENTFMPSHNLFIYLNAFGTVMSPNLGKLF